MQARNRLAAWALAGTCFVWSTGARAAAPEGGEPSEGANRASELAAQAQNPVANLISVPFQENLDYGIGPYDRARSTLNIQPVLPFQLSSGWNVIARVIAPVIYQPDAGAMSGGVSGLGDINPTAWLVPAKPGLLMWGVGPTFLLPTATQATLGAGKWGAGPSVVAVVQPKGWTIGALANNVWSFAGQDGRPGVNQGLLQYFVNYNLPDGWYLTSAPIITVNWKAASGDRWTVPFGGGAGKVFQLGKQHVNGNFGAYGNAVRPSDSADWQLRLQLAFLFPK
jgi:hypothetical protein